MELLVRLLYQIDQRLQRQQGTPNTKARLSSNLKSDLAFTRQAVNRLKRESSSENSTFVMLLESLLERIRERGLQLFETSGGVIKAGGTGKSNECEMASCPGNLSDGDVSV